MKGDIRERGRTAWEIKFDALADSVTGRRVTRMKMVHGAKRDVQRELRTILTMIDGGGYVDPSKLTSADWLRQWLDEAQHAVARKTRSGHARLSSGT